MARIERDWTSIRERHGLPRGALRHTAAACMCGSGKSVEEISYALGISPHLLCRRHINWSREMTQSVHSILPTRTATSHDVLLHHSIMEDDPAVVSGHPRNH